MKGVRKNKTQKRSAKALTRGAKSQKTPAKAPPGSRTRRGARIASPLASLAVLGQSVVSKSPIDGAILGTVSVTSRAEYDATVTRSFVEFTRWREVPAPKRGEVVRQIAEALRAKREELGALLSAEVGKSVSEGLGEIQEAIDIADFAVGLSRQLYGLSMHSERAEHRMLEQWQPLGVVGVISAFNFPVAVWAWNAFLAAVCGDTVIWKPSEKAVLCAQAVTTICADVASRNGFPDLFTLVVTSGPEGGKWLAEDSRIPLVSATGSTGMGRSVGEVVARRFGRSILELGGNNAVIVMADADLELTARAVLFGAAGTAGQRCTTIRRIFVHRSIAKEFTNKLVGYYKKIRIGDPRQPGILMGPLISARSVLAFERAVHDATLQGGKVLVGGKRVTKGVPSELFVEPTLIAMPAQTEIVREETFAPIAYLMEFDELEEAIHLHNSVAHGLSSAIFTESIRASSRFLSAAGSDCGIANVNIGTSGAEIGGAFGGEKETGGGREAGSDCWKQYMRRQTCTINYGSELPLAQGVKFEVG